MYVASQKIMTRGFGPLKAYNRKYLMASAPNHPTVEDNSNKKHDEPHIGQLRISFEYDTCSDVTIMAQQISDEKHEFTF